MGRMKAFVVVALAAGSLALLGSCTNPVLSAVKGMKLIASEQGDTLYHDAAIAANGGTLYVAYKDPNAGTLKFTTSSDNGETWTAPYEIDSSTNVGAAPYASVDGSTIYVDYWNSAGSLPKWNVITGGGSAWAPTSGNPRPVSATVFLRTMTDSTGTYAFYTDKANLYCSTWSSSSGWALFQLTVGPWISGFPGGDTGRGTLSVSRMSTTSIFAVAWANAGRVYCNVTHDNNGTAWSHQTIPTSGSEDATAVASTFTASTLCVAYYDATSTHVRFVRSTNEGDTWDSSKDLGSVNLGTSSSINDLGICTCSDQKLAVVFWDASGMHSVSSADSGVTWTAQPTLSDWGTSFTDDFEGNDGHLYLLTSVNNTTNGVKTQKLVMLKSEDNGATWY